MRYDLYIYVTIGCAMYVGFAILGYVMLCVVIFFMDGLNGMYVCSMLCMYARMHGMVWCGMVCMYVCCVCV